MSALFRKPKAPEDPPKLPEATPPPPTIDTVAASRDDEDQMRRRRRRGKAAALYTGATGAGSPQTATKTLLGQ